MKPGNILTLTFKSKKGKERLKRDGAEGWIIKAMSNSVQFSDDRGPWLLIHEPNSKVSRWIHQINDEDFGITKVI